MNPEAVNDLIHRERKKLNLFIKSQKVKQHQLPEQYLNTGRSWIWFQG